MREDWIEVELGNILKVSSGKGLTAKQMSGAGYPVYGGNGVTGFHSEYLEEDSRLIIGRVGIRCGVTHITKAKSWITDNALIVTPKANVFDLVFMKLKLGYEDLNKLSNSTAQPVISGNKIYSYQISLPPLPEQRAIVAKIEQLLSGLDAGIESLKKAEAQLKTYRQAVLKKAFEGELTKGWRAQQSNLPTAEALLEQIKEERAQHYAQQLADWAQAVKTWEAEGKEGKKPAKPKKPKEVAPLSEEELKQLPNLPEGWGWCKIGEVGSVGTGSTPKRGNSKYWTNGTIPWITSGALNNEYVNTCKEYVTEIALEETNIKFFPKHTLLVAMYGEGKTRGKCAELLFEATTNQAIAGIVQTGKEKEVRKYLKAFLVKNYQEIRRKSSGGVQPNINLDIVKNTLFPLCSLPEQQQIVQEIETRLSVCDQVEASIQTGLAKVEALRQSILKKAFEGRLLSDAELATCKNEKDWAPASTLLAQIEAEKAEAAAKAPKKASKKTKKKKSVK